MASDKDRDLLARLNALKKSTVDLDHQTFPGPQSSASAALLENDPARSLHSSLLERFTSLSGKSNARPAVEGVEKSEDDKTVEELLADLGPTEQWNVERSEQDEVEELLRTANAALINGPVLESTPDAAEETTTRSSTVPLPSIDLAVFQPELQSDDDTEQPRSKTAKDLDVAKEADKVLKRLLDEVRIERTEDRKVEQGKSEDDPPPYEEHVGESSRGIHDLALPSAPSSLPELEAINEDKDDDLATRFASLSLPSAPTTFDSKPVTFGKPGQGYTEDEIDSWCIICMDDATLSCLGCDGDLYCTNCWLEGHRGEGAGFEEKTHKAVQYAKGKKKKAPQRRVMMGA